jgi:MarR family transcriptional regulator, lower aerobic nicotinate degradation pathway regulator
MNHEQRSSETSPVMLLARLAKQVFRRSDPELLGLDLRLLMALSYLNDHDGAPQQELVDALCMDAKNVVLLLNDLEDRGHLVRRRDSEDRRRHRVYISASGQGVLRQAAIAQKSIEDQVLAALDEAERATLYRLLNKAVRGAEPALVVADAELASAVR